jgi:hypothetical protein
LDQPPEVRTHDLLPGERVLWSGSPKPGIRIQGRDLVNLPFGCVFTGFALFWTTMAFVMTRSAGTRGPFRIFFPLFGLPFILVGLYVIFGSVLVRAAQAKKTAYAITDRRLITVVEGGNRTVNAIDLERILSTTLYEGKDGSGSIAYSISSRDIDRMASRTGIRNLNAALTIDGVDNVSSVYATLESARAARAAQAGPIDP